MQNAVKTWSRQIAEASTLKLLLVGATCLFGGLIFLALINAMVRRPHAPAPVQSAAAEPAPVVKVPARIIMPTQADTTGSIPVTPSQTTLPPPPPPAEAAPRVQPMIGRRAAPLVISTAAYTALPPARAMT